MTYIEYKRKILTTAEMGGAEYGISCATLHPMHTSLQLVSLNGCTDRMIRIPQTVCNRFGIRVQVSSIGKNAFRCNATVTDIILSPKIRYICAGAFSGCSSLERIYIPKEMRVIHAGTFEGCTALKDVFYEGTHEEWDSIEKFCEKREYDFGELIPGTPVQEIACERLIRISGNEAIRNADIHFRCVFPGGDR